jgi:GNAT superfamily N-acetyltransferase
VRATIRPFEPGDAAAVAALFADYMREIYGQPSALDAATLLRDGQGRGFRLMVALAGDKPVGFAAWQPAYDLHHAVAGGAIPDLYVARAFRGRTLGMRLVATVARAVRQEGGLFVKGEVLTDDTARLRAVHRIAVGFAGESVYVSGRAFRELADLADADIRTLVAKLPAPAASREP